MKILKKIKLIILIISLLIIVPQAFAGDYAIDNQSMDYMLNPDPENSIVVEESATGEPVFEDDNTKVVRTKNKFFSGWKFGKRKKKNETVDKPVVIDYDYDTETEEIIPVVQETKQKEDKKDTKTSPSVAASNINIYCDNMEYFEDRKEIVATGSPKVVFTDSNSVMSADKIIFNSDCFIIIKSDFYFITNLKSVTKKLKIITLFCLNCNNVIIYINHNTLFYILIINHEKTQIHSY